MHNCFGKALPSHIYPIKYLDETIILVSSILILTGYLFLWNGFLLIHCLSKIKACFSIFILCKEKKINCYVDCFALQ